MSSAPKTPPESPSGKSEDSAASPNIPYDAIVLVSFGGPEGPEDVMPFLENVLRGRNVPRERMLEVSEHYHAFDGVSPINEQCRALLAAMRADFADHGLDLPVYWGNRNWHPMLADTVAETDPSYRDRWRTLDSLTREKFDHSPAQMPSERVDDVTGLRVLHHGHANDLHGRLKTPELSDRIVASPIAGLALFTHRLQDLLQRSRQRSTRTERAGPLRLVTTDPIDNIGHRRLGKLQQASM